MGKSKRNQLIDSLSIYMDISVDDVFYWTCSQGENKGRKYKVDCHPFMWEGCVRSEFVSDCMTNPWVIKASANYEEIDSITKVLKFYLENK